jgi:hypothetical protein
MEPGAQGTRVFECYTITSDGDLREAARKMSNGYNMVTLKAATPRTPRRSPKTITKLSRARSSAG